MSCRSRAWEPQRAPVPAQSYSWGWFLTAGRVGRGERRGPNRELVYTTSGVDQFLACAEKGGNPRKACTEEAL
ncbi:hypothetical protein GCM10009760_31200 [Kitasatospora kazusensis]|uniref:DUF397 domain-containing protein n=1 Tax=Kitasatospora kazusensis TaxID=407974 RepID=A0ABN2ZLP1_9ACTN